LTEPQHPAHSTPHGQRPSLLGRWRVSVQWLTSLTILLLPFVQVDGVSLLRLDLANLQLHAFTHSFPIEDLSLFLLLAMALIMLFLLVTLAFGRAWCGWACPQTTLVDLVEWLARRLGARVKAGVLQATTGQKVVLQVVNLLLALLVGANLVWYFVSPYDFFPQLLTGDLHWVALLTWAVVTATVFLDLALLRRTFCKEFCPYGRFQTVLVDPGTLALRYHPDEAPRCIRCGACVRACPTGIDIRNGYQIECINCGRCLDACREVMARRGQPGIIRYTFGLEGRGPAALLNLRMALVALALVGITTGLVLATAQRSLVTLKVARSTSLLPRSMGTTQTANFFTIFLTNRSSDTIELQLAVTDSDTDSPLELSGPIALQQLAPGEHRRLDVAILAEQQSLDQPRPCELQVLDRHGRPLTSLTVYLTRPLK